MRHNALKTIQRYSMLSEGCRIVVGCSGGADSIALLSFLLELRQERNLTVEACHVNHLLRGAEAQRDEEFCRQFCQERGVPLHVFRENMAEGAQKAGCSVEDYSRQRRYVYFAQLTPDETDRIATAHHANDLAETQLFHLARGTGSKGLIGIPPVRGKIIRPLLYCSRKEIEAYCQEQGLSYVTDSSNACDEYSRNRLRIHVLPQLEKINPAFVKSAVRLSKQLQLEEDYLEKQVEMAEKQICLSKNCWSRKGFISLHPALQQRLLARWLQTSEADCSSKKIQDMLKLISENGTMELCRNHYLQVTDEQIRLKEAAKLQPFFSVPMKVGDISLFEGKILRVQPLDCTKYKFFANNQSKALKNVLDCDKISGVAVIRQKIPGDAIWLPGHSKPSSFKKLLNQKKVSLEERSRLAVLCDEKGPLWLEGFGVRADVLPSETSKNLLIVHVLDCDNQNKK